MTQTTDTTMEKALTKAGYRSAERRLRELADESVALSKDDNDKPDFREALRCLDDLIGDDGRLLREAVGPARLESSLSESLGQAAARARGQVPVSQHTRRKAKQSTVYGGQAAVDTHPELASERETRGQGNVDTQAGSATGSRTNTAEQRRAEDRTRHRLANSYLDTIAIDGLPIRLCTKGRVMASALGDDMMARYKRNLAVLLPTDDAIVGDFLDDEHAAKAMELARQQSQEAA